MLGIIVKHCSLPSKGPISRLPRQEGTARTYRPGPPASIIPPMRSILIPVFVLAACAACEAAGPAGGADAGATVVATIHPLASVTRTLAGDAATVRTLMPPGASPDTYQTTPRDAEVLARADLVVRVGGAGDAWLGDLDDVPAVVFTDGMRLEAEAGHGTGNPHVWLDPVRVRDTLLPRLTDALVALAPDSAPGIRARAAAFADSLTALDAEIRALLQDAPSRRFISAHPAWVYFAERYDLEPVGVLHVAPGRELGSRALARLVDEARGRGVRAVLAEPQLGSAGVDAMAGELGARVETADPVGAAGLEGRDDYLSLMRFNARAFARALGAEPG